MPLSKLCENCRRTENIVEMLFTVTISIGALFNFNWKRCNSFSKNAQ